MQDKVYVRACRQSITRSFLQQAPASIRPRPADNGSTPGPARCRSLVARLSRSPFPGNGISGPEKNVQKRPADCNGAVSENEPSHRSPPIRDLSCTFRKSPVAHDCVVVGAVRIERVSAAKFLSIREKNREFCKFKGSSTIGGRKIADVADD